MKALKYFASLGLLISMVVGIQAATPTLVIDAAHPMAQSSPTLYGLMTEAINHSYAGGLYAELVQNRAFMDNAKKPVHWSLVHGKNAMATMALDPSNPFNKELNTSLRLIVHQASKTHPAGIANDGYWGIPVHPRTRYHASFYAKSAPGFAGPGCRIHPKQAIITTARDRKFSSANGRLMKRLLSRGTSVPRTGRPPPT